MHPETFSNLAERLDQLVRDTTVKIVDVSDVGSQVEACVRLSAKHGGGDITSAIQEIVRSFGGFMPVSPSRRWYAFWARLHKVAD